MGNGWSNVKLSNRALFLPLFAIGSAATQSALAETRSGAVNGSVYCYFSNHCLASGDSDPVVPRLLNYIVAIYLILIGLIGLFGV